MQVILKPITPLIQEVIKKHGADQITRIDLDEDEFERFYNECRHGNDRNSEIDLDHARYSRPRRGSYVRFEGVSIQCCYE